MPQRLEHFEFFRRMADFGQILAALEMLPGTMFAIKDRDSRYISMSRSLRQAIHVDAFEDVIGKTDFDLFPKMIAQTFRKNDELVFDLGQPLLNEVHLTCFFAAAPVWSLSSKFPLRGQTGEIIGLILINETCEKVMGRDDELTQLLPAIDHVSKHFSERIIIRELADLCKISTSYFMRIFKERLKTTAHGFVEQIRMYHALDALKEGQASIMQVALDCGFYDHSAFVKRFKQFTGTTPLKYRRKHQAERALSHAIVLPTPLD